MESGCLAGDVFPDTLGAGGLLVEGCCSVLCAEQRLGGSKHGLETAAAAVAIAPSPSPASPAQVPWYLFHFVWPTVVGGRPFPFHSQRSASQCSAQVSWYSFHFLAEELAEQLAELHGAVNAVLARLPQ